MKELNIMLYFNGIFEENIKYQINNDIDIGSINQIGDYTLKIWELINNTKYDYFRWNIE
jgi:hypothetical protein